MDEVDDVAAVRKTVTVLFADLVGSTAFGERVDAESTREVLAHYHAMTRSVIEEHGGSVAKFIGDGVMGLFGVPETTEDDAIRAITAGVALQAAFRSLRDLVAQRHGSDLGLRVGINTGEVVIAEGDADIVGDAINVAARLEAACAPGQVLVGEDTWRLTRSAVDFQGLGTVEVKGKSEPIATYQVLAAGPADDDSGTPFVGREGELARLRGVFDAAVGGRMARLATVVGAPGVGKTRLSHEFCLGVHDVATIIEMRCRRSGTATFAPVADHLRAAADLGDLHSPADAATAIRQLVDGLADADRVAELLTSLVGVGPDRSTEEAFFAVRRLVESQARQRPVVIVVDDIQWAEPLFLDLLEHLAEWVDDAPTLILALARPEIREIRPALATEGRLVPVAVALEGLDAEATAELAAKLVGAAELPAELIGRLPHSTEGNPLFVRELMRMLVDDGVIIEAGEGWELTIEAEAVEVPPTIQSLLSARLDRMPPDERRLVELASVVGSEFPLGVVAAISEPGTDLHSLRNVMDRLRRRELVESAGRYRGDEPVFRFHHVLIRDAAYRRLLKRRRAELHIRVGEWMERTAVDLPGEHETPIAFHFEQAFVYRRELSDLGEETDELGRRAAGLLHIAAVRALDRDDIAAAGALVERAVSCLDSGDPELPDLLMLGCEALLSLGDVPRSRSLVGALAAVGGDDRQAAWIACFEGQLTVLTEPGALHDVMRRLDSAADDLTRLGDDAGVAKARLVRAGAFARLGRIGESESELDLALTAARAADDRRRVAAVLGVAPVAALWGPSPVSRAGGRCLDVIRLLRITTGSPSVEAVSTRCQAVLEALRGRFDTARTMLSEARATVEELGLRHEVLETQLYAGIVELLADEPADAEPPLRDAYKGLAELGIDADAGQAAAYLARALLRLGRVGEADALAGTSDALAGQTPQTGIVARAVQAEVLAARGHPDAAVQIAREAVEIASATDLVIDHADATSVLAAVAPDPAESAAARDTAAHLYESKGATLPSSLASPSTPLSSHPIDHESGSFSPADIVDEVAAHTSSDAPRNRAADTHERYFRLHLVGEWDRAHALFADDVVIDDRRDVVGRRYAGQREFKEAYDTWTFGPERSSARTLATRSDNLAVRRCIRSSEDRDVEYLAVVHLDADGRIDRVVSFDAHDVNHAIDELYRQYEADLVAAGDLRALLDHRGLADHREAIADRDIDRYYSYQDPSGEIVDHRPVGWGTLSIAESHERLATLRDLSGELETYVARILRSEPNVLLMEQVLRSTSPEGGVSEEASLFVVRERSGLVVRTEQFHVGEIDAALRSFDEQCAATRADGCDTNAASVVGDYVRASIATWGRLRPVHLSPDCSVVGADGAVLTGDLGSLSDVDRLRGLGVGVNTHRILGLWDDRVALVELRDDDVDGVPFHQIAVEEIDEHARLCSITHFEPTIDGLRAAAELATDRADRITPPARVVRLLRTMVEVSRDDVDAFHSHVNPAFELVDHRAMGFGTLTAEAFLGLVSSSEELLDEVHVPQGFFRADDRGLVTKLATIVVRPNGEFDIAAPMCMVAVFDDAGRVVRQEMFEESDEDAASSRLEELTGARTPASDEPWNRADAWCRRGWASLAGHDREGWRGHLSDDIVLDDRRSSVGGESTERGTLIEQLSAINDAAIGDSRLTTIAIRGERLVLQRHELRTDEGTSWAFLAVCRLGDDGRVAHMTIFDVDALAGAIDELDRLFLDDPDSPLEALAVRRAASVHRAFREGDVEALESMSKQSSHRTDHSPLGWGAMGTAGMDERRTSLFELDVEFLQYLTRVHYVGPHCMCIEVHRVMWPTDGGEYESTLLVVEDVDRSTDDNAGHMYAPTQLDEAIAAARNRDESMDEPANAASAIFGALHMWHGLGRPTVHEPHFAADFEIIDGTRHDRAGGKADVLGNDAPAWLGADRRVLLAYGDETALVQLVAGQSPEERWFALEWTGGRGDLLGLALFPRTAAGLTGVAEQIGSRPGPVESVPEVVREFVVAGLDLERLAELLSSDFQFVDRRMLGYPRADRDVYLEMVAAIAHEGRGVTLPIARLAGNQRGVVVEAGELSVRADGELVDSGRSVFVTVAVDDGISVIERFPADAVTEAVTRFEELTRQDDPAFDNLARRVGRRVIAAMNDGTVGDRLDELFVPGWQRIDHRTAVSTGTLDAATMAQSVAVVESEAMATPIANRGDHFTLSRGTTNYGPDTSSTYLVLSEIDSSARQTRVDFYDEEALDDAMAELERRWYDTLTETERHTFDIALQWGDALEAWDRDRFAALMAADFRGYLGGDVQVGWMGRDEAIDSRFARSDVQGSFEVVLREVIEFARPDTLIVRFRATRQGRRWESPWEDHGLTVIQVRDGRVVRNGVFSADDLDRARAWASARSEESVLGPVFDNLAARATVRVERAMNDGTLAEHLDDWYEPDFERVDHRTVIGTGTLDLAGYLESVPDFYSGITHVPVAARGDRFLLARATMRYDGGNDSDLLVLVEMSEAGRLCRTILFDADALDDAMAELDHRWARTLSERERATLRTSGQFLRAWIEQDYDTFDRILDPDFRSVEHTMFGDEEADRARMQASWGDADNVFGRRRMVVDHIELPTPDIVLTRHSSRGTSPSGIEWEVAEWSILQLEDGRVLRNDVFEDGPKGDAASQARRLAEKLVAQARRVDGTNRAVQVAEAVFSEWTAGDAAADLFAVDFERVDRRAVGSAPDVGRDGLLSTVVPEILALRPHCEISDVLLTYDGDLALVRAQMASDDGTYEVEYLMAEACDDQGRLIRTTIFDHAEEDAARRELGHWWASTLSPRRVEVSQLAVAFGESWVAPSIRPFVDLLAPDFTLVDGRTLGLGELDRDGFVEALIGRENDGTAGPPVPSRVRFVGEDVLVFRAANRGITPGTEIEWEEIACNIFVTEGDTIRRVEMFDEDQWDRALDRALHIAS